WAIALQSGHACAPHVGCAPRYPVKVEADAVWIVLQPVTAPDAVAEPAV
ncbi:nitrite reductase (NAD(P)H) small subunit, partial [Xanthomonas perforans]|nr:nitrite reductase (NAD(P)H) small subunit [Xanthomonas perforans]